MKPFKHYQAAIDYAYWANGPASMLIDTGVSGYGVRHYTCDWYWDKVGEEYWEVAG